MIGVMRTVLIIGGAPVLGVLLYLSQDSPILLPLAFLAFTGLFYILDSFVRPRLRLICIALFVSAYALSTFSFLSHVANTPLGLLLVLIPWAIYMMPMLLVIFCKRFVVESFVLAWILGELVFVMLPIGNPYLITGTPLSYVPFAIQWYQFTGPIGGSIWLITLSYLFYRTLIKRNMPYYSLALGAILPVLWSLMIGWAEVKDTPKTKVKTVSIVSLQAGNTTIDSILLRHRTVKCDYILSPEAVSTFSQSSMFVHPTLTALRRSLQDSLCKATVFIGVFLTLPDSTLTNGILAYSRESKPQLRFKKRYIPFGEYMPYRDWLGEIAWIKEVIPYDLTAVPNSSEIVQIGSDKIAPLICYEGVFIDDLCTYCNQGAEVIFIAANNEAVNSMHCERQMVNINRGNAIAVNRYIVRATQEGMSYVVDNRGKIQALNANSDAMIVQKVAFISNQTFYSKYHDGIIYTYLILCIGGLVWCIVRSRRNMSNQAV